MVNQPEEWPSELKPAFKEFEAAEAAFHRMVGVHSLEEYEVAWRDFLHHIDRIWKKTIAACSRKPKFRKLLETSSFEENRNADPLLSYLRQARNSDEHTIAPLVKNRDLEAKFERVAGKVIIKFKPWDIKLLPFRDRRGNVYDPPDKHLGKAMSEYRRPGVAEPRIVAELALRFYVDFLNQVARDIF